MKIITTIPSKPAISGDIIARLRLDRLPDSPSDKPDDKRPAFYAVVAETTLPRLPVVTIAPVLLLPLALYVLRSLTLAWSKSRADDGETWSALEAIQHYAEGAYLSADSAYPDAELINTVMDKANARAFTELKPPGSQGEMEGELVG